MSEFNEAVADWLRTRDTKVDEVTNVQSDGSDMAGDTEGGFYERFEVLIGYYVDGKAMSTSVGGEDLASLWDHVVRSWPRRCVCVCHDPKDPRRAVHGGGPCICEAVFRR